MKKWLTAHGSWVFSGIVMFLIGIAVWGGLKPLTTTAVMGIALHSLVMGLFVAHVSLYVPQTWKQWLVTFLIRFILSIANDMVTATMKQKPYWASMSIMFALIVSCGTLAYQWVKQRKVV